MSAKHMPDQSSPRSALINAAPEMLATLEALQESAAYWSEYDVPVGIVERINEVVAKAKGKQPIPTAKNGD